MFLRLLCTTTTKTHQPDLLAFLVLSQLTAVQVLASVYPTQPVADTVYTLGQLAEITWKDDGWAPQLKDMGLMEINLYASTVGSASNMEFYVASLAKEVAPVTRSHIVVIPLNLPTNSSFFTLRFKLSPTRSWYLLPHHHTSLHPHAHKPETIYSADFQIVPLITQAADSSTNADPFPISLLLPQSQSISAPTPIGTTKMHTWADNSSEDEDRKDTQAQAALKNGNRSRGRMEKAKFRLLFMLWPALVGVSMAV